MVNFKKSVWNGKERKGEKKGEKRRNSRDEREVNEMEGKKRKSKQGK